MGGILEALGFQASPAQSTGCGSVASDAKCWRCLGVYAWGFYALAAALFFLVLAEESEMEEGGVKIPCILATFASFTCDSCRQLRRYQLQNGFGLGPEAALCGRRAAELSLPAQELV